MRFPGDGSDAEWADRNELAQLEASLKACRRELEESLSKDFRRRGLAAAARDALNEWMQQDPTRWVPEEVTDLLEVLR